MNRLRGAHSWVASLVEISANCFVVQLALRKITLLEAVRVSIGMMLSTSWRHIPKTGYGASFLEGSMMALPTSNMNGSSKMVPNLRQKWHRYLSH